MEIEATTGFTPLALQERPRVAAKHVELLDGFYTLHQSRSFGFNGPNPLSMPDFAGFFSIFPEESADKRAAMIRVWQALDGAILDKMYEKSSKESKT